MSKLKSVGKVYRSISSREKCLCGKEVVHKNYTYQEEGLSIVGTQLKNNYREEIRISICDCGNVFIRQNYKEELTQGDIRELSLYQKLEELLWSHKIFDIDFNRMLMKK